MKKIISAILAWAVILLGLTTMTSCDQTPGQGSIYGFVYEEVHLADGSTRIDYLEGVTVHYDNRVEPSPAPSSSVASIASGSSSRVLTSVTSDADGQFVITGLELGSYALRYVLDGYEEKISTVYVGYSMPGSLNVSNAQNYTADGSTWLNRNALTVSGTYDIAPTDNLVLTYNKNVDANSFRINETSASSSGFALQNAAITIADNVVTIDPARELPADTQLSVNWDFTSDGIKYSGNSTFKTAGLYLVSSNIDLIANVGPEAFPVNIVPTLTFNTDLVSLAGTSISLQNNTSNTRAAISVSLAGTTFTVTPAGALDAGASYTLGYTVSCSLNSGTASSTGYINFTTQATAAAAPGQVTHLALNGTYDSSEQNFNLSFQRASNAAYYAIYGQLSGTSELKLLSTISDIGTYDLTQSTQIHIASGVFGSSLPLDKGQSIVIQVVALNADLVAGTPSTTITLADTVAENYYDRLWASTYDNNSNSTVLNYMQIDSRTTILRSSVDTPIFVDANGQEITITGLSLGTPVFNSGDDSILTIPFAVEPNTAVPQGTRIRISFTDESGNAVSGNRNTEIQTGAIIMFR